MGQFVPCPSCKGEFRLSPANLISNAAGGENKTAPNPPAAAPSATATLPQAPPVIAKGPNSFSSAVSPAPATSPLSPAAAPAAPKKTARFAAVVNAPSTVTLTADGKLPELQLTEALSKAKGAEAKKGSNPILLVAAFTVSALCTMLMLFWEPGGAPAERDEAGTAHKELQHYYQNISGTPKPYQTALRESQRAYARGDKKAERDEYKRVLDMLHEEGRSQYKGLTGTPSSDRELERLLGILLRTEEN